MEQVPLHRRGGGRVFLLIALSAVAAIAGAAEVLFPAPLHLTRRIEDPLSGAIEVEEYCAGNRMVTVHGQRVVIADYDRQEITEIDRERGTYSITRFDEIARATPATARRQTQRAIVPRALGIGRGASGRPIERFAVDNIELGIDRDVKLPKAAIEVLLGAAYPNQPSPQHDVLAAVAESALPAEQTITVDDVTMRNVITRVGTELVPAELLAIPPGAKRVESRFTATLRTAGELDRR